MKALLFCALALSFLGCSRKYQDYPFIKKSEFGERPFQTSYQQERPAKLLSGRKEIESFCAGQILFNQNAEAIAEASLPALVGQSCPGEDYLLNARVTRLWWTTLVYSRSCVKVESFCPQKSK